MEGAELKVSKLVKPWDVVIELGDGLPEGSWALVGGLMTQAHAMIADTSPARPWTSTSWST